MGSSKEEKEGVGGRYPNKLLTEGFEPRCWWIALIFSLKKMTRGSYRSQLSTGETEKSPWFGWYSWIVKMKSWRYLRLNRLCQSSSSWIWFGKCNPCSVIYGYCKFLWSTRAVFLWSCSRCCPLAFMSWSSGVNQWAERKRQIWFIMERGSQEYSEV